MRAGWQEKKLGDVLALEYGKPLPPSERSAIGKYAVYGANGIKDRSGRFYSDRRSIIVGGKGSAGEITLTEEKFWPLDVTYFVTFDETKYDLQFLYHLLSLQDLTKLAKGVKPGINRNEVYSKVVRVPPLPEQQRIVAILDEAFAGLATASANAEKNLKNARELFESQLQFVFTTGSAGWKQCSLGQICSFGSGGTPAKDNASYWNGSIPWVSGKDMKSDRLSDAALHISQAAVNDSATRIAPIGSLLILVRGMGLANGIAVAELMSPCAFNQDIKAIHPNPEISPRFLLHSLRSAFATSDELLSNAAHGTLRIEMDDLRRVPLLIPSLKIQEEVAAQIDSLAIETQHLTRLYHRKLAQLSELKQSILQKAFSGDLTSPPLQVIREAAE